jgi:predicted GIY-YIG superfamily endonuclease
MSLSINPLELPSLSLDERRHLPDCAAVYFAIDAQDRILYIGKANRLVTRWQNHHRRHKLQEMHQISPVRLAWQVWSLADLAEAERSAIQQFHPLLNNTEVESPAIVPSEVVLRDFLKAFSRRLLIIGMELKTTAKLPQVHLKYDWQNWSAGGTATKIKAYIQENKGQNTSLKFKYHRYSRFEDFALEVFRPGSRALRTTARQHRSYNNHWEFACNGVVFHITPTDHYREYKLQTQVVKLAGINFRSLTDQAIGQAKEIHPDEFVNLSAYSTDPVRLLWRN